MDKKHPMGHNPNSAQLREQYPNQPWMWKPEWAEGRIRTNKKKNTIQVLIFTILFNAISWPVFVLKIYPMLSNTPIAYLFFVMPAFCIGLIALTIHVYLRWKKYGDSELELVTHPGVLGEKFGAIIHTGVNIDPAEGFDVTLENVRRYVVHRGKNSHTHSEVLWREKQTVHQEMLEEDKTRSAIPVYFQLPSEGARATDESNRNDKIFWVVKCHAKMPGVDFQERFEVPVIDNTVEIHS